MGRNGPNRTVALALRRRTWALVEFRTVFEESQVGGVVESMRERFPSMSVRTRTMRSRRFPTTWRVEVFERTGS